MRLLLPIALWGLTAATWAWAWARHDASIALGDGAVVALVPAIGIVGLGLAWSGPLSRLRGISRLAEALIHGVPACALATVALALGMTAEPLAGDPSPAARGPHVVLVTLDTFRADHLGAIGGGDLTPNLDALAADGALFTEAISTAPLTAPAHATLLTGRSPVEHGLLGNGGSTEASTVTPEMHAAGRRTGAFVSARVLDRVTGLDRGFQHYDDRFGWLQRVAWPLPAWGPLAAERRGDTTVARALGWLHEEETAAFLWVHLYDPHAPYEAPEPFAAEVLPFEIPATASPEAALDAIERASVPSEKLRYAAEIRWTDHLVGQLVAALPPDAVIVISGDHGESLDEHGYRFNHGALLHEPALRVPLIVRWPGQIARGARSDALVSIADVAGLLRHAAGLTSHDALSDAISGTGGAEVLAFTPGQQARTRMALPGRPGVIAELHPAAALRYPRAKLLADAAGGHWFDLAADPEELAPGPVPADRLADLARLQALLADPIPQDADEHARLRALGYEE